MAFRVCPECNAKSGPRLKVCPCGHVFQPKPKEAKKEAPLPVTIETVGADLPDPEPVEPKGKPDLYGIAGPAPAYDGNLADWLQQVRDRHAGHNVTLPAAISHLGHDVLLTRELREGLKELFALEQA